MLGPFALKEDIRKFLWFLHKPWKKIYTLNDSEIFLILAFWGDFSIFRGGFFGSFSKYGFSKIIKCCQEFWEGIFGWQKKKKFF